MFWVKQKLNQEAKIMILAYVGYRRYLKKEKLTKIIEIKTAIKIDRNEIESEKLGGTCDGGVEEVITTKTFSCLEKEVGKPL